MSIEKWVPQKKLRLYHYGSVAMVIVYPHTLEIGLWVAPEHRHQGWGQKVFKTVVEHCIKPDTPSRLYARVDTATNSDSEAMCKILLATKFQPIIANRHPLSLALWARCYTHNNRE